MLQALILICAYGTDPIACTADTAISRFSINVTSQIECMRAAEMTIALTAVSPIFGREYEKVVCANREATR